MKSIKWQLISAAVTALGFGACSAWDEGSLDGFGDSGVDGLSSGGSMGSGGGATLPPEEELEESFRSPVVAGPFVFSANPESNRVARIDARNLQIEVFDGGNGPTFLTALPAGETGGGVLVANDRSDDASLFVFPKGVDLEAADPEVLTALVPLQAGASAWAVGQSGKVAISWSRASDNLLGTEDGYQDVTVLSFSGASVDDGIQFESASLSVGFRPSRVEIAPDEKRAFVVSDPGITVLSFESGAHVEREIFLPDGTRDLSRDVSFDADGRYAFVRLEGESEILIVDLETDDRVTVELPGVVTDLDLSVDGETGVAVVRGDDVDLGEGGATGAGSSQIILFSLEALVADAEDFDVVSIEGLVGSASLSPDGKRAVLYTNATPSSEVWILDVETREKRSVDVRAPVRSALVSPTGDHAVTIQQPATGSTKAGAFAVVPLRENLPTRIEGTEAPPSLVSMAPDGKSVLVTTLAATAGTSASYLVQLPGFRVDRLELPSRPLSSGIVMSARRAFVAQEHPEGRISFIGLDAGDRTTVTGFELGSKVVDE